MRGVSFKPLVVFWTRLYQSKLKVGFKALFNQLGVSMGKRFALAGVAVVALFLIWHNTLAHARPNFVFIGTGSAKSGLYYPTGGNIAKMVNYKYKQLGFACRVKKTAGSVYNINAVLSGTLDFGMAQSDRLHEAWLGLGEWEQKGRQGDLRAVFALYPELSLWWPPGRWRSDQCEGL